MRYRKLPINRLPSRIISIVGEMDYYLQEIRYTIETEEDIARLWSGVEPCNIKIFTLDAGQIYVMDTYIYLSRNPSERIKDKTVIRKKSFAIGVSVPFITISAISNDTIRIPISTISTLSTKAEFDKTIHYNLTINQKIVL